MADSDIQIRGMGWGAGGGGDGGHPDPVISHIWLAIFAVCNFSYLEILNILFIV